MCICISDCLGFFPAETLHSDEGFSFFARTFVLFCIVLSVPEGGFCSVCVCRVF